MEINAHFCILAKFELLELDLKVRSFKQIFEFNQIHFGLMHMCNSKFSHKSYDNIKLIVCGSAIVRGGVTLLSVVFVNAGYTKGLIVLLRCFDLCTNILKQALVFSSSYLMLNLIFGLN